MEHKTPGKHATLSCSQKISLVTASVSALAILPATGQAAITHFDTSNSFSSNITGNDVEWDIDNDGTVDFTLFHDKSTFSTQSSYGLGTGGAGFITVYQTDMGVKGSGTNKLVFNLDPASPRLANLPANTLVENAIGAPHELNGAGAFLLRDQPDGFVNGNELVAQDFNDQEDGIIGFVFTDSSNDELAGWARINMDVSAGDVTIQEWAFENTAGVGIRAGATSAVPLPAALPLTLLGLGALGVTGWRSKRKASISPR
ncbi:MAG: PEP-CTERM sorting domain-containing protein [Gammaproteobacteria bacterium]